MEENLAGAHGRKRTSELDSKSSLNLRLRELGSNRTPLTRAFMAQPASIYAGRPDAVHGQLVIEYERPEVLRSEQGFGHAKEQLVGYLGAMRESGHAARRGRIRRQANILPTMSAHDRR